MGFPVKEVAAAFDLMPGTVSGMRTEFRRGGAAAVVKKSGRRATLTEEKLAEAAALAESGQTQQQLADRSGVTQPAISHALRHHRAARARAGGPAQRALDDADAAVDDDTTSGPLEPEPEPACAEAGGTGGAAAWLAPRIEAGEHASRYVGVMLAHAYLDRLGASELLVGLAGGPQRRYDQAQISDVRGASPDAGRRLGRAGQDAHPGPRRPAGRRSR
jgi:transposase-like protein